MGTIEEANLYLEHGCYLALTGFLCKVIGHASGLITSFNYQFIAVGQIRKLREKTSRIQSDTAGSFAGGK